MAAGHAGRRVRGRDLEIWRKGGSSRADGGTRWTDPRGDDGTDSVRSREKDLDGKGSALHRLADKATPFATPSDSADSLLRVFAGLAVVSEHGA